MAKRERPRNTNKYLNIAEVVLGRIKKYYGKKTKKISEGEKQK